MKPVSIVTIKNKIPLFKDEEKAERIELIELEEVGFNLVAGKDIYQIGDKAVFIQPDYNVSDISLFESFIRPNGDESKSMLGKVEGKPRRIRAKKFNFHIGNGEVVYSNGILLPEDDVIDYLKDKGINFYTGQGFNEREMDLEDRNLDLEKELQITKYEEPETNSGNLNVGASKPFPTGVYKTDESNIHNVYSKMEFPITLVGTEKIDGSSITIGIKEGKGFICSRNMEKPLTYMKTIGIRKMTIKERIRKFFTGYIPDLKVKQEVENTNDDFLTYGKPILEILQKSGYDNIILRGELHGGSLKGSGNKNNPARLEKAHVKLFGVDFIKNGIATKISYNEFVDISEVFNLPRCKEVFNKEFNSIHELLDECNNYFKTNMIEGIVVRTLDSTFSAKVMNLEYDSKK